MTKQNYPQNDTVYRFVQTDIGLHEINVPVQIHTFMHTAY